jgi:hypothetical protein
LLLLLLFLFFFSVDLRFHRRIDPAASRAGTELQNVECCGNRNVVVVHIRGEQMLEIRAVDA